MKTRNKRQQSIKTKLMAAICMLLVSSIMMVSTTYAWFTLSTAPEVTGITTSVGANGSLEMALLPTTGLTGDIDSSVGDSYVNSTFKDANVTWGNLVSMLENDGTDIYGLNSIKLMPAGLNATKTAEGATLGASPLLTPSYGADGRVSALTANTISNGADEEGLFYAITDTTDKDHYFYGVRAVGTASQMSQRELDYRNFRQAAATASSNARTVAATALAAKGNDLAMIAITHATGDDKYYAADMTNLNTIATEFTKDGGVISQIEDALASYIKAIVASGYVQTNHVKDDAYETFMTAYRDASLDTLLADSNVQTLLAAFDAAATITIKAEDGTETTSTGVWTMMKAAYDGMVADMTAAIAAINTATGDTDSDGNMDGFAKDTDGTTLLVDGEGNYYFTWATIRPILGYFADPDKMTVNGMTTDEISKDLDAFVDATAEYNYTVNMVIATGGGVFADVADFCSDYDTEFKLTEVNAMSMTLKNVPAYMTTKTSLNPTYLTILSNYAVSLKAPAAGSSDGSPITDMYGYIVDLAFRTNAAGADLLLQTEGIDRIYADQNDESTGTMGHGSTMSFKGSGSFGLTQVKELMKAINVVFFDTMTGEIYGIAKLDMNNLVTDGTNGTDVCAYLYLYEYTVGENGKIDIDMNLKQGQSYATEESTNADGTVVNVGDVTGTESAVLKSLTQNVASTVSVLVYLDGHTVENADVAADAATSMTGSLNLQFATSATLNPMNYTPLQSQGGSSDSGDSSTTTYNVTATGATVSATTATAGQDFTFTLTDAVGTNVTATVGGTAVTVTESNGTYTIAGADVTGDIAITVTAN